MTFGVLRPHKRERIAITGMGVVSPVGHGVTAAVGGIAVAVGSARHLRDLGLDVTPLAAHAERTAEQGKTAGSVPAARRAGG